MADAGGVGARPEGRRAVSGPQQCEQVLRDLDLTRSREDTEQITPPRPGEAGTKPEKNKLTAETQRRRDSAENNKVKT